MKITIESGGHKLVINEGDLEGFDFSIPCEVIETGVTEAGYVTRELGPRTDISLTGTFKDGIQPMWEQVN